MNSKYLKGSKYCQCSINDSVYIDNGYDKFYIFPDSKPKVKIGKNEYLAKRIDPETVLVTWVIPVTVIPFN